MSNQRTRNWTFIVYPESVVDGWVDLLQKEFAKLVISPLHDKDINLDNEEKKSHYHVMIMYDGVKSYKQVSQLSKSVNGTNPQVVGSAKGLVRYMLHLDNPEKAQYNAQDILYFNGVDINELLKPSSGDRYTMIKDMLEYIEDNEILEFEDILYYAMNNKFDTWFPLLCDNSAYIISQSIMSKRNRFKDTGQIRKNNKIIDLTTGEVIKEIFKK